VSSTCILRFPVSNSYEFVSRKRRLNDKSIPNVILYNPSFADDSRMYQDLLEMERKLDWTMMRKRVEIQDALGRVPTVSVAFRVVFYTSGWKMESLANTSFLSDRETGNSCFFRVRSPFFL